MGLAVEESVKTTEMAKETIFLIFKLIIGRKVTENLSNTLIYQLFYVFLEIAISFIQKERGRPLPHGERFLRNAGAPLVCCSSIKKATNGKHFHWPPSTINLMKNNLQIVKNPKGKLIL